MTLDHPRAAAVTVEPRVEQLKAEKKTWFSLIGLSQNKKRIVAPMYLILLHDSSRKNVYEICDRVTYLVTEWILHRKRCILIMKWQTKM